MYFSLLMLAAASAPNVTYLACDFPNKPGILNISADEANSSVSSVFEPTGYAEKYPAAFTPTEVRFENELLIYVVSRTDLSIRRTIKMLAQSAIGTDVGGCKVVTPPKRAF